MGNKDTANHQSQGHICKGQNLKEATRISIEDYLKITVLKWHREAKRVQTVE